MKHLPQNINCKIIPHGSQRYDTAGDYEAFSKTCWNISISLNPMGWRAEALVLIHELVEMVLTKHRNVKWKDIDNFDINNPQLADPGTSKLAPYHREHMFAVKIERMLCKELGIDWDKYDNSFAALKWRDKKHVAQRNTNKKRKQ